MQDNVLALVSKYLPGPFKPSGDSNVITICPFHKGGQERRPSFSINLKKGLFHCFTGGCPAGSGTIEKLLELLSVPKDKIKTELTDISEYLDRTKAINKVQRAHRFSTDDVYKVRYPLTESILGAYSFCPTSLVEQGFDPNILQRMEVGYDISNNRIMYPIRDMHGTLASFSGGITPLTTTYLHKKYKVYRGKYQNVHGQWMAGDFGEWFDEWFQKEYGVPSSEYRPENHNFLWNFHNVWARSQAEPQSVDTLYVVEGFKACLWMIQAGFENTVALMGSYVSERQQYLIHRLNRPVVLCLDNDEAGRKATIRSGDFLLKPLYGRLRVLKYPDEDSGINTQPDDYEIESLKIMVASSITFFDHKRRQKGAVR